MFLIDAMDRNADDTDLGGFKLIFFKYRKSLW